MDDQALLRSENPVYQHKVINVVDVIADWFEPHGGLAGKDVLEFGCGEGTVALGMAMRKAPNRVVGVEILDIVHGCADSAHRHFGLPGLPDNLTLQQIDPGDDLGQFGTFDFVYCWSVFEHVHQDLLEIAFRSIADVLKPDGLFFLQISPLYYSRDGSHLAPWVSEPWAHLSMEHDGFQRALFEAPATPDHIRKAWSVYIPTDADRATERQLLWETYVTLNKATAPQLQRAAAAAGLEIVRDYRTRNEDQIPAELTEIFNEEILRTEQVVWLLKRVA